MKIWKIIYFVVVVVGLFGACVNALEGDTAMTVLSCFATHIMLRALEGKNAD